MTLSGEPWTYSPGDVRVPELEKILLVVAVAKLTSCESDQSLDVEKYQESYILLPKLLMKHLPQTSEHVNALYHRIGSFAFNSHNSCTPDPLDPLADILKKLDWEGYLRNLICSCIENESDTDEPTEAQASMFLTQCCTILHIYWMRQPRNFCVKIRFHPLLKPINTFWCQRHSNFGNIISYILIISFSLLRYIYSTISYH